jgi:hypothetical protein
MQDIEDLMMPVSEDKQDRRKRLETVRRNFKKKELENKSSEMIENQKLFLQRKKQNEQKSDECCGKEKCCDKDPENEVKLKNDFCGSEHDNWQPDILDSEPKCKTKYQFNPKHALPSLIYPIY